MTDEVQAAGKPDETASNAPVPLPRAPEPAPSQSEAVPAMKEPEAPAAPAAIAGPSHRDPNEPTMGERARALVATYERAMETNSPRTMAELNELRALLLGKG